MPRLHQGEAEAGIYKQKKYGGGLGMPEKSQDPFSSSGPFSAYLDPVNTPQPTQWENNQRPSGYMGATGNIAFLGTKLLQGITAGRVQAFAKKEQQKMQTFGHLTAMMEAIRANPAVSPEVKASIEKQYAVMLGKVGSSQIKDSGATKDKDSPRGHIARTIGSVFDRMAGGPFKGDPLTVEDMSNFMATATKAIQGGDSSASSAYEQQQKLWASGEQKAIQIARQNGRMVPTREDYDAVPEINKVRGWFQQYDPKQGQIVEQKYASVPAAGSKQWAQAEYAAISQQPRPAPATQPPDTRQGGYLENSIPKGTSPAEPPEARSVARLGDTSVVRNPPRQGPPEQQPQHEEDTETYRYLREIAGIGPKEEATVPIFSAKGEVIGYGPKSTAEAYAKSITQGQNRQKITDTEDRANKSEAYRNKVLDWRKKTKAEDQTTAERRVNVAAAAVNVAMTSEKLRELERTDKTGDKTALAKLIAYAGQENIPFSKIADHIDEVMENIDDPSITEHQDYILDQISKIKKREQTNDFGDLFGIKPPAKSKTTEPPAKSETTEPPVMRSGKIKSTPANPVSPNVRKSVSGLSKKFGGALDGYTPAEPPAPHSKNPPPEDPAGIE